MNTKNAIWKVAAAVMREYNLTKIGCHDYALFNKISKAATHTNLVRLSELEQRKRILACIERSSHLKKSPFRKGFIYKQIDGWLRAVRVYDLIETR